ncbi:MAG: M48 family metalloprotease [Acidobacteria bacterium]|nr:M48 family metalloprotease [Acidobacteriota bacterium]
MRSRTGRFLLALLSVGMVVPLAAWHDRNHKPSVPLTPAVFRPLQKDLQKHYLTLFKESPELEFSSYQIQQMHDYLDKAKSYCVGEYKNLAAKRKSHIEKLKAELHNKDAKLSRSKRRKLRCKIQKAELLRSEDLVLARHAIPIAYANKEAKLDLIQQWPSDLKTIKQELADGAYRHRRWGDVQDIGFRVIAPGQRKDIKTGQEAVRQMKESGLMPPPVRNKKVVDYVKSVAEKVAAHSDLHVPLHVTVLNSNEINAFSFPGGYIFVDRGLLNAADNEAELAGVIGHEIGHVVARHGHKLMERQTVAGIFYQGAQVAAMVLTGGIASIGTYYAIQYGFYGLSMALDLRLLGVSRQFELQADQLGIQYAWNSGYDPEGFIRFFDKMATDEGYVNGVGWFYDHPPFYLRMKDAMREIMFLPKKKRYIENTTAFMRMKKELVKVNARAKKKAKNRPSLHRHPQGCPAVHKVEYKAGEPIETLCHLPGGYTGKQHEHHP